MFTRSSTSLLVGSLLLAPMMVLAGCEDFGQQGELDESEPGMVEEEQTEQRSMETETREQRREAERESEQPFGERTETERAERTETERPDEPLAGEEEEQRDRAVMAMTDLQVELPAGIQAGSYDLRCPLQGEGQQQMQQTQQQQQQQEQQQEQQVVQLHITVEESGEQQGGITGN